MPSATACASVLRVEFEDGVHALAEFRIGQADDDAGAHLGMLRHRGLDLRRIDVGAAAQDHVGEAVAEIEIAFGIQPSDVAERFPAVGAALRLGAEIMIGASRRRHWAGNRSRRSRRVATSLPSSPMMRRRAVSPILPTEPRCSSHSTPDMIVAPCARCRHRVRRCARAPATRSIFPSAMAAWVLPCETRSAGSTDRSGCAPRPAAPRSGASWSARN